VTTTRTARPRAVQAVLGAVLAIGLAACTGADAEPPAAAPSPAGNTAPPPDDRPVATDPPRPTAAEVVLSLAEWDGPTASIVVGGYVSPVVEEGGTCTAELERAGRVVRLEEPAIADATTTVCGGLTTDGADLGAGTWSVVLRYESPTVAGASDPVRVEVPA
jgi:hypothetical protein